jgi:hypothetical protein
MSALVDRVPLQAAISNMGRISGYDEQESRLLIRYLTETQYALQYMRMRLQLGAGAARILVRGYADGERGPWQHKLNPAGRTIALHKSVSTDVTPEAEFTAPFPPEESRSVLGRPDAYTSYGNEDLPNLRGARAAGLITNLQNCSAPPPSPAVSTLPVWILEGRVYPGHAPVDRKARVYLLVFLKP